MSYGAFECGRIYRVYEFRLGNNVRVMSQLVFASRELVTKKAAPVSDLHLVSIIACNNAGDNGTEKFLITLNHV